MKIGMSSYVDDKFQYFVRLEPEEYSTPITTRRTARVPINKLIEVTTWLLNNFGPEKERWTATIDTFWFVKEIDRTVFMLRWSND